MTAPRRSRHARVPSSPTAPPARAAAAPAPRSTPRVRAVWWEGNALCAIDQRLLPRTAKVLRWRRIEPVAEAIRTLTVRGAPTIGAAAAFGMVLASRTPGWTPERAARLLAATRPTAHDLFVGIATVQAAWSAGEDPLAAALAYRERVVQECHALGRHGAPLLGSRSRVLTHCNAGALATVEWGSALAPVRVAHLEGRDPFVWVDETRPLLQGSRLTAWELQTEGIRHAVIADNAAGHFLHRGEVDLVIVGADRITRSGDFANKVGTYEKAVLAHENGVPFYAAAPWSTFDPRLLRGEEVPVEERGPGEVLRWGDVPTAPRASPARNPAFDVTPGRYVTAFITPAGVVPPSGVDALLREHFGKAADAPTGPAPVTTRGPRSPHA